MIMRLALLASHLDGSGHYSLADRLDRLVVSMRREADLYDSLAKSEVDWDPSRPRTITPGASLKDMAALYLKKVIPHYEKQIRMLQVSSDGSLSTDVLTEISDLRSQALSELTSKARWDADLGEGVMLFEISNKMLDMMHYIPTIFDYSISFSDGFLDADKNIDRGSGVSSSGALATRISNYPRLRELVESGYNLSPPIVIEFLRGLDLRGFGPDAENAGGVERNSFIKALQDRYPTIQFIAEEGLGLFSRLIDADEDGGDDMADRLGYPESLGGQMPASYCQLLNCSIGAWEDHELVDAVIGGLSNGLDMKYLKTYVPSSALLKITQALGEYGFLDKITPSEKDPRLGDNETASLALRLMQQADRENREGMIEALGDKLPILQNAIRSRGETDGESAMRPYLDHGFMLPEETRVYIEADPRRIKYVVGAEEMLGSEFFMEMRSQADRKENAIASSHTELLPKAEEAGVFRVSTLRGSPDMYELAKDEGMKLGLEEEDIERFADVLYIYYVDTNRYTDLARRNGVEDPSSFMGLDTKNANGLFKARQRRHDGTVGPVALSLVKSKPLSPELNNLYENLGISTMEYQNTVSGHEVAHWLHDLRSGTHSFRPEDEYSTDDESEMSAYFTSVPENIAYAHGELPHFLGEVMKQLPNILNTPKIQEAIRDWAVHMVLSSEDAVTLGLMNSRQMMQEAQRLHRDFNVDILEYMQKRLERQGNLIISTLVESQRDSRRESLMQIQSRLKEIEPIFDWESKEYQDASWRKKSDARQEQNLLKRRRQNLLAGGLDFEPTDAAEAITHGFIRQYFTNLLRGESDHAPSPQSLQQAAEHSDYIMDATFGGTSKTSRPLTSEHLPMYESPQFNFDLYEGLL